MASGAVARSRCGGDDGAARGDKLGLGVLGAVVTDASPCRAPVVVAFRFASVCRGHRCTPPSTAAASAPAGCRGGDNGGVDVRGDTSDVAVDMLVMVAAGCRGGDNGGVDGRGDTSDLAVDMLVMVAATLFPTSIAVTLHSRPDNISRVSRLDAPSTSPSVNVSVVGIVIVDCGSDSSGGGDRGGDNSGGGGGVAGDNVKSIGHRGVDNCCGVKSSSYSAAFSAGRGSDQ